MPTHTEGKITETEDLETQRGIFQGDSLSTLKFCVTLFLLTEQLHKLITRYEEHRTHNKKVSHLFYVDDLKMIDKTNEEFP
jgi:hypothetical protein